MIVGVFLNWISIDIAGFNLGTATGWDVFDGLKDAEGIKYTFLPLLYLICGVLAIVMMIIPTFANVDGYQKINSILGIVTMIFAIAIVIISILFFLQSWDVVLTTIHMSDYIQYGFWICMIGAIVTIIGGIMPYAKNKMN